jgi:hypothetical protein
MDYEIRPTDIKHAVLLPVGQEGEFKLKDKEILLAMPEGSSASDHKMRSYEVVSITPNNTDSDGQKSSSLEPPGR